jgi:NAD(P)-dependent dehydrogenase (short-subunit alcohol dehydrogenase family)
MDVLGYAKKRVLITGCYSGMGHATAKMLLDLGAEVHGIDYKECDLPLASFNLCDMRFPDQIDAAVEAIGSGGRIDAVFSCAGLPQTASPLDVMRVNYAGTRRVAEKSMAYMSAGSSIASISSTGGLGWSRNMPKLMELIGAGDFDNAVAWCEANLDTVREGYSFSKEAIIVWTLTTACQSIKKGIRINCTLPSPTQTPMMKDFLAASGKDVIDAATQPSGQYSTPEQQAQGLIYLNSDLASFVNGVFLPVDGGFIGGVMTGQVDLSVMMQRKQS